MCTEAYCLVELRGRVGAEVEGRDFELGLLRIAQASTATAVAAHEAMMLVEMAC